MEIHLITRRSSAYSWTKKNNEKEQITIGVLDSYTGLSYLYYCLCRYSRKFWKWKWASRCCYCNYDYNATSRRYFDCSYLKLIGLGYEKTWVCISLCYSVFCGDVPVSSIFLFIIIQTILCYIAFAKMPKITNSKTT